MSEIAQGQILNRPKCINYMNCGNEAITLVNRMWLCGPCLNNWIKKMEEKQNKIFLEEVMNGKDS